MFPHWSLDQLRDAPAAWLTRQLKMDEIAAEVAEYQAEEARKKARAR